MESFISHFSSDLLPENFLKKYVGTNPKWGFGNLGYIVYKRTYARILPDGEGTEEWWQTIARCINGAQKIGADYTEDEAQKLYDHIFNLRCSFAGRMLWQLGTKTVDRFGANSLLNCFFVSIRRIEDFCFLFENLMLGGGVGFSVKREDIHDLPKVWKDVSVVHQNTKDADFIVPDSRQGWVELLRKTLTAYFIDGKSFTYSTILVRGSGELIKGFGGTSSGPRVLIEGIEKIVSILSSREGKKLRSIDVLDICNIIGSIVVAGNVRRSALIALGDPDDYLYLRAKRWDLDNIPNWRAMSNNTLFADNYTQISDAVWDGYLGNGEPYGFFNLPLAKKYGRLGEKKKDNCEGLNPCGEISLASGESCNLSEIFMNNITSKEIMLECAQLLYKTQKAVCAMPFVHEITNEIVHKNMRIGIGVTGICQSMDRLDWLDFVYKEMHQYDIDWSAKKGYNESIKLTTIKPSGTVSLLSGSSPGAHPGYAQHFIRRVRMASADTLVQICRDMGYHIEFAANFDGSENHDTVVVSFPCEFEKNTLLSKNMTAIQQLDLLQQLQTVWSDNAVSMTIYYSKEELPEIKGWMKKNYKTGVKSVSFLLHSEHGFKQAPYEEISEAEFIRMVKKVKPISSIMGNIELADMEGIECEGGACPIK